MRVWDSRNGGYLGATPGSRQPWRVAPRLAIAVVTFVLVGGYPGLASSATDELPPELHPLVDGATAVIWCRLFSVTFGAAQLAQT